MKDFSIQEEIRDGFLVDTERKKLWEIELDILEKVKKICEENNIKYFAAGGTLLGAVRHGGFIPWDDDIDIHMPYEDYKRFLLIAQKELKYPYFLQNYLTEKEASPLLTRIRRSDTTGCTEWEYENVRYDFNMGIFIDIFPLFYIPKSNVVRLFQKVVRNIMIISMHGHDLLRREQYLGKGKQSIHDSLCCLSWRVIKVFCNYKRFEEIYINLCNIQKAPTDEMGVLSYGIRNNWIWPCEYFKETIELPFENTMIKCPQQYEQYLTKQFGDWKTPVMGTALHSMKEISTVTSYKETLKGHIFF